MSVSWIITASRTRSHTSTHAKNTHVAARPSLTFPSDAWRPSLPLSRSLSFVGPIRLSVRPCFSLSPRVISLLSYPFRAGRRRRQDTRAWTRSFANGVSALFCIVYLPLSELCDVAARARARGRPLFSRAKFTRCYISAQDCTPVNTSTVTTLVFGMPGMAQRIWTTHTPAAQPVCAHADTA